MKNQKTFYEWDMEMLDENGDIDDHDFSDKCPGIPDDPQYKLVLVRDTYEWPSNDPQRKCDPDLVDRLWAYVENGNLPEYFSGCDYSTDVRVPIKFHRELADTKNDTKAA